jgi:HAE1 family hydrophobic/amphiphilic exporter-1
MQMEKVYGLSEITRHNMSNSSEISGAAAPGVSSGEAIRVITETARQSLPRGYDIDWAGISIDEVRQGNQAIYIFIVSLVFVYLILSAQYESFILPLAVILSLPAGVLGAFLLLLVTGLENNIYAQIAMVMLIGLLGKNAVLIVEFASQKHSEGASVLTATLEGARTRFRPILMTSFAFIAGLIPLMFATGPGKVGNRTIGSAAFGGMLVGTLLGVILIPGLYYAFARTSERHPFHADVDDSPLSEVEQ